MHRKELLSGDQASGRVFGRVAAKLDEGGVAYEIEHPSTIACFGHSTGRQWPLCSFSSSTSPAMLQIVLNASIGPVSFERPAW